MNETKTTMRAATVVEPLCIRIEDVPIPEPGPGEARVRLEGTGVCASNIPPWEGREWFTYPLEPGKLGHEGWGIVDAVGPDVKGFSPGDRVGLLSNHAYAEYDVASAGAMVHLPPALDGQPFPAEPLGCAVNIFRRSAMRAGDTVAIIGVGFLGALLTRMAKNAGAQVIGLSRRDDGLNAALRMGADETIPMREHWKIIEQVKELTGGVLCDVVIEATGKQWPLDLAGEITKERGRMVVAGYHQDGLRQVNLQLWNWRGLDVINAHERDPRVYLDGMQAAVEMVTSGEIDPSPLYTHTYPLERLDDALNATKDRPEGFMKALIKM